MLPLTPLGQVLSVPFLGFSFLPSETRPDWTSKTAIDTRKLLFST